jgi:hypothetical protein
MMSMLIRRACILHVFVSGCVCRELWWRISRFWQTTISLPDILFYFHQRIILARAARIKGNAREQYKFVKVSFNICNTPAQNLNAKQVFMLVNKTTGLKSTHMDSFIYLFLTREWILFHSSFWSTVLYIFSYSCKLCFNCISLRSYTIIFSPGFRIILFRKRRNLLTRIAWPR